jgi:hypothetical protein
MKPTVRCLLAAGAVVACAGLLLGRGDAQGDKGPWQPILPKDVYQELVKREADIVRERLADKPDDEAIGRAKFGAVLIAALTMSVKDGVPADDLKGTREAAMTVAKLLANKNVDGAKKLAADLPNVKADPKAKVEVKWAGQLTNLEMMLHFHLKTKGGDGMHPDLQSNIKFKGPLNGIEEKIRLLSIKELTAAGMKKEAKELELLGYRSAVVGALSWYNAPATKKDKKDPDDWRTYAVQTRDNGVALAQAAQKGDTMALLKASNALNSSCSQCHTVFRTQ